MTPPRSVAALTTLTFSTNVGRSIRHLVSPNVHDGPAGPFRAGGQIFRYADLVALAKG
jgi:hypothetical protein